MCELNECVGTHFKIDEAKQPQFLEVAKPQTLDPGLVTSPMITRPGAGPVPSRNFGTGNRRIGQNNTTARPSASPPGPPSPTPTTMAAPLASRSPTCLACLRRLAQPFANSNGSVGAVSLAQVQVQQVRAKSNRLRPKDQGVVVRLLEDIPKFGRKGKSCRPEQLTPSCAPN